ncbi:hypothetical protein K443DRAFT_296259 [Laccaria amethystina LaAM-08-1]|uniref:Uncharacterized protein n=1 Tax=Laccaria amethystina LaAM-08-1 TaxID=1095629 RepID=A0A0C9WKA3_9AGAR|nr:hypothetical protein K443DRAFT_296259 [Laccaria amethystina LaAM-08-1]
MIAEKTQKSHPDSTASIFTAPNNLNDEAALGFVGRGMTLGYMLCPGVEPLVKVTLAHRLRDSSATELGAR